MMKPSLQNYFKILKKVSSSGEQGYQNCIEGLYLQPHHVVLPVSNNLHLNRHHQAAPAFIYEAWYTRTVIRVHGDRYMDHMISNTQSKTTRLSTVKKYILRLIYISLKCVLYIIEQLHAEEVHLIRIKNTS